MNGAARTVSVCISSHHMTLEFWSSPGTGLPPAEIEFCSLAGALPVGLEDLEHAGG